VFEAPTAAQVVAALIAAIGEIVVPVNQPPNVTFAVAQPSQLWPPNGKLVPVSIVGVVDPDGDDVSIVITGITQDEPVLESGSGDTAPDGVGVGTGTAAVRAERSGRGNGRVYQISFTATDSRGASATGSVKISVGHDQGANSVAIDDGQNFDSTVTKK
jgi:hypothetical protein